MTTEKIDKAVNDTISENVVDIAETAAAQVDRANKDAEAIARAAVQSDHVARLNQIEEGNATWRASMEQKLAEQRAEASAALAGLQASIQEKLTAPPAIPIAAEPILVPEPVNPSAPTTEGETKTKSEASSPNESQKRKRVLL